MHLLLLLFYSYTYVRVSLRYNDPVKDKWIMPGTMSNIGYLGALRTTSSIIESNLYSMTKFQTPLRIYSWLDYSSLLKFG